MPPKFEGGFLKSMDPKKLKVEKLKMWNENLAKLEEQLVVVQHKKGAAAQEGDLSENAAYTMAIEDAETLRVQIDQVKKIISDIEKS
ncbi:hypothetical protein A3C59_04650 [Candidatus Daviesbacteria bacterium RIFCSPHIGHO2_02_FULL_36_13]|uniref:Transcription elongation factor GreA/GreB N-terminal domain-containing protein n=1 Tax=Candidatus Daviesbacteria bacterium RIFCSPHIGHO2_02_FULL_36_13 TaxID=1797768 RepID=A0A1F5JUI5_9BACT|nr:MAG: hypothetical protein A3C59_04650 [Candidatus Daviesbacteria bacterium RIFCSPHIGHO2_02_FULL_36_13]